MEHLLPPFPIYERLLLMRLFAGFTQTELANALQCSQSWLSKAECGRLELSALQIATLRSVFGLSADAILDGMIPYREIAQRLGRVELLPAQYRDDPKIQMRAAFPFLTVYQKYLPASELNAIFRALDIKKFIFADPSIPVNVRFLWDLISQGQRRGIFEKANIFQELSTQIVQFLPSEELSVFTKTPAHSRVFFERWIELACRMGGGHEFNLVSLDSESAVVEVRCLISVCNKKPKLASVFDEYYRSFLSQVLSEKEHRQLEVKMVSVRESGDSANAPIHVVRYGVRWN